MDKHDSEFAQKLRDSLSQQEINFTNSLLLNPVENIPFFEDLKPCSSYLHGYYNTDKLRTIEQQKKTIIQFAGRQQIAIDIRLIYEEWAKALNAEAVSMRILSGLQAHMLVFQGIAKPGDTVLLLPELAGGHASTKVILENMQLKVVEMCVDFENHCIDIESTISSLTTSPDFIFVDRSEGLTVEDFWKLTNEFSSYCIYDASQYLTNIIAKDHPNPFDHGFDLIISSMHKNFPGPQRALVATAKIDPNWDKLLSFISTAVSNMHVYGIYTAGLTLARSEWLKSYSKIMLKAATLLEEQLIEEGLPMVKRNLEYPSTHHLWLRANNNDEAFNLFLLFESANILTNYRKLPYHIGYGIRMGICGIVRQGLRVKHIPELTKLLSNIYYNRFDSIKAEEETREFIKKINDEVMDG